METHIKVKSPKIMALVLMLGAFVGLFGETALNMALTNVMDEFLLNQVLPNGLQRVIY